MQYRSFGKLDWKGSALGFGCARLPLKDDEYANIDEPEAIRMIRYAIDHGVNYLDTAYPYHGGNSERVVGKALQGGYRDKVKLATKLPPEEVKTRQDCDRILNEQFKKLQTDHIDVYLLHGLTGHAQSWPKLRDLGVLTWAEGAISDGRIGCLGFSFHDYYEVFQEIVDAYDGWAMCQIQHNYMDIENQAGTQGLQYAASKGLAVVIMEPLLGGKLAQPPAPVQQIWDSAPQARTPIDWALQWLWDQPEVSVVLSGMSEMAHVAQNVASAAASRIGALSAADLATVDRAREAYRAFRAIACTQCKYCMPCPNGVNIPANFYVYNHGLIYDDTGYARWVYNAWEPLKAGQAEKCIQCRECEEKCTQHIEISAWMPQVHAVLGEQQPYPTQ